MVVRSVGIDTDRKYDNCFLKWYSESMPYLGPLYKISLMKIEFLRGTSTSDECKPMFDQYEKCLSVRGLCKGEELLLTTYTESTERARD